MAHYLEMDGVDDYIKTPTITFDRIVLDWQIDRRTDIQRQYFAVPNGTFAFGGFVYLFSQTDGKDNEGNSANMVTSVNGVDITVTPAVMVPPERHVLKTVFSSIGTGQMNIFSSSFGAIPQKGRVYDIKFYNGATLIAHYDCTLGNVQDQSGNGNHATLNGGTWLQDAPEEPTFIDLAGTSASASSSSASKLHIIHRLTASSASTSEASANLKRIKKLTGTSASTSSTEASLKSNRKMQGSMAASSEGAATLYISRTQTLAGASSAASAASASLSRSRELGGAVTAQSSAEGTASRLRSLAGQSAASSEATSSFESKRSIPLAGTSSAAAAASGSIRLSRSMAGESSSQAEIADASLKRTRSIAGTSSSTSEAWGSSSDKRNVPLAGAMQAASDSSAQLHRLRKLSGASTSTSEGLAVSDAQIRMSGECTANTHAEGSLQIIRNMAGVSQAEAGSAGTISRKRSGAGASEVQSLGSGTLYRFMVFRGMHQAGTAASGNLHRRRTWAGDLDASSSGSGQLSVGIATARRIHIEGVFNATYRIKGAIVLAVDNGTIMIYAGDTALIAAQVSGQDLLPMNLVGCSAEFLLYRPDLRGNPLLLKSTGDNSLRIAPVDEQPMVIIDIKTEDTEALKESEYPYRVRITNTLGQTTTVSKGKLGIVK